MIINEATRDYVRRHADEDVGRLALRGCKDADVDMTLALNQIKGRQTARRKLPSWAAVDGLVYPPHLNMEQCSSEPTARYKAQLCRRLLATVEGERWLTDLTGGFGVDCAFMQEAFSKAVYVERDAQLFAISSHNFGVLGISAERFCTDGTDYLRTMPPATLIFLDPARRDDHGARTYGISDCTPDVLSLLPLLLQKGHYVLLKLSPMLDWRKAVADLGLQHVSELHIVSVQNECKELLILLSAESVGEPLPTGTLPFALYCANDADVFVLPAGQPAGQPAAPAQPQPGGFLFEPNASLMKAGCFAELSERFGVAPIARDSHLFVSSSAVAAFPGRQFVVEAVTTMNKRDLRQALAGITRANIATRNFPLSVADLRRRLKLADGGDVYLFATTTAAGEHLLLRCRRLLTQPLARHFLQ